jgi:hypothetical protein
VFSLLDMPKITFDMQKRQRPKKENKRKEGLLA